MKNPKVLQGQLIIQRATHHFSLKKALSGILLVIYMNISFVFSFQQLRNKEEVENEVTGKKSGENNFCKICKVGRVFIPLSKDNQFVSLAILIISTTANI